MIHILRLILNRLINRHRHAKLLHFFKAAADVGMEGALAGKGLPAADDGVAIKRIEFEDVGAATGFLGGN